VFFLENLETTKLERS